MICLYKATVDDIIRAFMQIANYCSWIKGGSSSKGLDRASLKLKAATYTGDPKFMTKSNKVIPWSPRNEYKLYCI